MTSYAETCKVHIISDAEQYIITKSEEKMPAKFRRKFVYDAKRSSILKIFPYQTNFQTGETISLTQKHLLIMKQNANGERMMQKRICSL